jgi:anti-sigma B factor antagonist
MDVRRVGTAAAVITVDTHLTGGAASVALTDQVRHLMSDGVRHIIIDCSQVELVNSSGLGMLVAALTTIRAHDGRCCLAAVPVKMRLLLEITHLDSIFQLSASVSDALASNETKW